MSEYLVARDLNSKAVVSVDNHGLSEYKKARRIMKSKENRIKDLEGRLDKLEQLFSNLLEKDVNGNNPA